jgi:hypothetical protein
MYNDDAMFGFQSWRTPYRFVIYRKLKWDPNHVEVLYVSSEADTAYYYAQVALSQAKGSIREATFDYCLTDSFNKDAISFCKEAYEKAKAAGKQFQSMLGV